MTVTVYCAIINVKILKKLVTALSVFNPCRRGYTPETSREVELVLVMRKKSPFVFADIAEAVFFCIPGDEIITEEGETYIMTDNYEFMEGNENE